MKDPNINYGEYESEIEEEKYHRQRKVYNWKLLRSENDNDKFNMPLLPSPKPAVSYFDDLDFFKDFENEFPAIVYWKRISKKITKTKPKRQN
ncbi:hypothetical protein Tco_0782992 [Tanacetum coccineum]